MTKASRAADFLQNMAEEIAEEPTAPKSVRVSQPAAKKPAPTAMKAPVTRAGLKHIGGYFDDDTVEKVAILRARLKLDNSGLIKRAIDELHSKHLAKRAFGDA